MLAVVVTLWAPTTWTLVRVRLLPGIADPRLRDDAGLPVCPDDILAAINVLHIEYLLGVVPALLITVWLVLSDLSGGWMFGLLLGAWTVFRLVPNAPRWSTSTAAVLLQVNQARTARARLEPWARLPWWALGSQHDRLLVLLTTARFRTGDLQGAIDAIDAVRTLDGAEVHRAAIGVARNPDLAREVASRLDDDDDMGLTLTALAAWHDTPPREVEAQPLLDAVDADGPSHQSRILPLLAAAALAPTDANQARALLQATAWTRSELDTLATGWPAVTERLSDATLWH